MSSLLRLPDEILVLLPPYLANIEDLKELSSTCRRLRAVCCSVSPKLVLKLAAASSRIFFRPDPYFLVAATAKQIGSWALLNENNADRLRDGLKDGIGGLFDLCVENVGLTMEDIRRLHISRFSTFNPVIDLIDRCAGKQWYSVDDFWYGGRSDAETIDCEPERALFEIAIYGSLFHATLEANLEGRKGLDLATRLDFIKYCIPDWYCSDHRGFHVEETGPYLNGRSNVEPRMDQYSIRHILKSSRWNGPWDEARRACGADFDDDRRQKIWVGAVQMQGLEGFEMLRPDGANKWRERMLNLRKKIENVDVERIQSEEKDVHGEINWLECPILEDEIYCCVRGMWPQYVVQAFGPGLDEDDDRTPKTLSPAKRAKLDARARDAELWTAPKKYPKMNPFLAFAGDCRKKDPSSRPNDAWDKMTPDERLPFVTPLDAHVARYQAELQAFNARIPLSPLVDMDSSDESDSDSDADNSFEYKQTLACRRQGGHPPSEDQRINRRAAQLWNRYRRDYPGACGGVMMPVPDQPFRFLDLLPELRTAVYRLILYRPNTLVQMEPDQSGPKDTEEGTDEEIGPIDVRIFAVSRQMYEEASSVFFGQNLIKIELVGSGYLALPSPMFRIGFQPTNQDLMGKLKRVELDITTGKVCEWALKLISRELASRTRLNELKINAYGLGTAEPDVDAAMDEMLEILTVVRGVGRVIFNEPTWKDQTSSGWSGNNGELRILGSQAQRERVSRIMTTMD
ncbi:MAG: hypothetical protein Q9170_003916 [Blastenia crenularia]